MTDHRYPAAHAEKIDDLVGYEPPAQGQVPFGLELARCFLRLCNLPNYALDRLSRYEAILLAPSRADSAGARQFGSSQATGENAAFMSWQLKHSQAQNARIVERSAGGNTSGHFARHDIRLVDIARFYELRISVLSQFQ